MNSGASPRTKKGSTSYECSGDDRGEATTANLPILHHHSFGGDAMRRLVAVGVLCVLSIASAVAQTQVLEDQREGAAQKKAAEQFYESLHVVPPGMNWRVINEAVRGVSWAVAIRQDV